MPRTIHQLIQFSFLIVCCLPFVGCGSEGVDGTTPLTSGLRDGSKASPLRVMLVPADGGTEEGTLADFEPIFNAITAANDVHFDLKVGQSYNAVVQGMVNGQIEIAFFGPVTYMQAKDAGAAELLAVAETDGESVYYSGIFVPADSPLKEVKDLAGKSMAFGDVNSTSSFNYPVAMLLDAGLDPPKDLTAVYMTGSHSNSLQALQAGKVDAACASVASFEKAVANGQIDPQKVKLLAKSAPIPYPPLAMHTGLEDALKTELRSAFSSVHQSGDVRPEMIRGYGGQQVDRYIADFPASEFDAAMARLASVTKELKEEMLAKAGERAN